MEILFELINIGKSAEKETGVANSQYCLFNVPLLDTGLITATTSEDGVSDPRTALVDEVSNNVQDCISYVEMLVSQVIALKSKNVTGVSHPADLGLDPRAVDTASWMSSGIDPALIRGRVTGKINLSSLLSNYLVELLDIMEGGNHGRTLH